MRFSYYGAVDVVGVVSEVFAFFSVAGVGGAAFVVAVPCAGVSAVVVAVVAEGLAVGGAVEVGAGAAGGVWEVAGASAGFSLVVPVVLPGAAAGCSGVAGIAGVTCVVAAGGGVSASNTLLVVCRAAP